MDFYPLVPKHWIYLKYERHSMTIAQQKGLKRAIYSLKSNIFIEK